MARGVNKVIIIGNLGQDPEVRYLPNGNPVANLSVATDESYKDRQTGQLVPKTEWHRVSIFGKIAEVAGQYLSKGSKVYIEGKLQTRKWQGQDGQDRYTTEIVVDINGSMQMLDSRPHGANQHDAAQQGHDRSGQQPQGQNASAGYYQHSQSQRPPQGQAQSQYPTGSNMPEPVDDFDDDIPF